MLGGAVHKTAKIVNGPARIFIFEKNSKYFVNGVHKIVNGVRPPPKITKTGQDWQKTTKIGQD